LERHEGHNARMAELVDAPDSKSGYRKVVQVRFLFRAQYPSFEGYCHFTETNTGKPFSAFLSVAYFLFLSSFPFFGMPSAAVDFSKYYSGNGIFV
jgi:hypothetical protein